MIDSIPAATLGRLHPQSISEPLAVRALLQRICAEGVELRRGTNRHAVPETAVVDALAGESLWLRTQNFERDARKQVFLNLALDGRPYFFTAPRQSELVDGRLRVGLPAVIYEAERRDRMRQGSEAAGLGWVRIRLGGAASRELRGRVEDLSPGGVGLSVPAALAPQPGTPVTLCFLRGDRASEETHAEVRYASTSLMPGGWRRVGLALLPAPRTGLLPVEHRECILPGHRTVVVSAELCRNSRVVEYRNRRGESIRALFDSVGDLRGAPIVVIPPAWGKTKETLLPLAETLLATFEASGYPLGVLRLDGIRRRGESHNDPGCMTPGNENLRYTFTQGAADIESTLGFLESSSDLCPSTCIVVSFSVASIEARRAIAREKRGRVGGWVSVVGASDPQSLIRVISGGIDYLGGADRGAFFGHQEVQGLLLDIDHAAQDALRHEIAFLDDARRDLAEISVPITWIHGRFDAWNDLERVRTMLSTGDASQRRLIEAPIGHQLKSSREAMEVFQLVAAEVGRLALGIELAPAVPDRAQLVKRRRAERGRLASVPVDLRAFWCDYLVGRDGGLGIELVSCTTAFRDLMNAQVKALGLRDGERVFDLGSGTGVLPLDLRERAGGLRSLELVELDYVAEGLCRARERLEEVGDASGPSPHFVLANLDVGDGRAGVPLRSGTADAILASLLLNYLSDPDALLAEAYRLLRPGGRVVVSSLRRDADVSRICVRGVAELRSGLARSRFGGAGEQQLEESLRGFINDAARLLDLEERGVFHFWDSDELAAMARNAGLVEISVEGAYGDPPQALVLRAERPRGA